MSNVVPIKPALPPWDKYMDKVVIDQVEAQAYKILNEMAEAGDPKATKIIMQAWKTLAKKQEQQDEDDE